MPLPLTSLDWTALTIFMVAWVAYEPLLKAASRGKGLINTDMTVIRGAWMQNMARRENRFMDGQLLGIALNSNSFLASSNLILIAAAAGALFGGERSFQSASSLIGVKTSSRILFELQIGLVVLTLARGLLAFIWSMRQVNYLLAVIGAAPDTEDPAFETAYGDAAARLLNPALSSSNAGVRGYYFALAAASWLLGPWAFMATTIGAVALLVWRQRRSPAAGAVSDLRHLLEGLGAGGAAHGEGPKRGESPF
jgi:uncharacterized membrane protein